MNSARIAMVFLLLLLLTAVACAPIRSRILGSARTGMDGIPIDNGSAGSFSGGAEWGFFLIPQVGNPLADLRAVSWSRMTGLWWGRFQKADGSYDWSISDEQVQKAQQGGYGLVLELKTGNNKLISDLACYQAILETAKKDEWFAGELGLHSCPLKPEYISHWKDFVRDVIERYDGDGNADMPGLKPGFKMQIQIENEPANPYYWHFGENDGRKAAESLLVILKAAAEARDEADPDTRIILPGLIHPNYLGRCAKDPGYDEYCSRQYFKRNRAFSEEILKHPEYFDAVDVHFFNYFKFDPHYIHDGMEWLRAEMRANGYQKPIYSLEWTGSIMMMVTSEGHADSFAAYFPYSTEFDSEKAFYDMYKNLAAPENKKYREWFEAEQAREFPKLFTTMLAEGVEQMVYVRFSDYAGKGWNNTWWNWQGIVRYTGTESIPVLVKKPSYYTYMMLEEKLSGFSEVERVEEYIYKFNFADGHSVYVLWSENGEQKVNLGMGTAKITHIITKNGQTTPKVENSSGVEIVVDSEPVLVERS